MQYPQIQFYRGSLVRLASGKLKHVEDLCSEDFLMGSNEELDVINVDSDSKPSGYHHSSSNSLAHGSSASSSSSSSSTLNVSSTPVAGPSSASAANTNNGPVGQFCGSAATDDDDSLYVDSSVVRDFLEVGPSSSSSSSSSYSPGLSASTSCLQTQQNFHFNNLQHRQHPFLQQHLQNQHQQQQYHHYHHQQQQLLNYSLHNQHVLQQNRFQSPPSSCPQTPSPSSLSGSYLMLGPQNFAQDQTVLIKFFLESSRSIVFCEVPTEHPFLVYHRGWSSWNPQRTYDKFGLKCRKLKIGDTCVSLIRRRNGQQDANDTPMAESDQCNIMFSSIKLD